jgi:hypothetical protein
VGAVFVLPVERAPPERLQNFHARIAATEAIEGRQVMKIRRTHVLAIVLTLLAYVPTRLVAAGFGPHSLNASYGFSGSGTLLFGTIPAAVEGLAAYDGSGHCTVKARLNGAGFVLSLTSSACSYTVNTDGTGTQTTTFNEQPHGPFVSDFVIVDNTHEIRFILSDLAHSTIAHGVSKIQGLSE